MPRLYAPIWLFMLISGIFCSGHSDALDIIVTNDDGFEASTVQALYRVLKAHGHRALIASEAGDNSGKGGALDFFAPISDLTQDTRAGSVKAGAPGVGASPIDPDIHYVNATPVAAALYGIDVLARDEWRAAPDLVISGPNYGNNTGLVNNQSGTVNAALIAINRGIPAIAVSTANPSKFRSAEVLKETDPEFEDAELVATLIAALEASRSRHGPLMPPGLGLNVNIPDFAPGTAKNLKLRWSQIGSATHYIPVFVEDLSADATARAFGVKAPAKPGISVVDSTQALPDRPCCKDQSPTSEDNVLRTGAVSVSVMHGNHQATGAEANQVRRLLGRTVAGH